MVALGAYVAASKAVGLDTTEAIIRREFQSKPKFIEINVEAMKRGAEAAAATKATSKILNQNG